MNAAYHDAVWIASMGAISSIGMNVSENFDALLQGKSGISYPEYVQTLHRDDLPVCEIKMSNEALAALCKMPNGLPRTAYLSAIAAQEALQSLNLNSCRLGMISANTVGGMDRSEFFYQDFLSDHQSGHLRDVVHHECGSITELVAHHLGIQDYISTISTACSSSANAILHGARLIRHGILDAVLVGGADALCRFTINGFNTLMILDNKPCTPFDQNRKGLNLGEAAAYLVLVSDQMKQKLSIQAVAKLSGAANANDAFHQTASSAEGKGNYLAMSEALKQSGLSLQDIHYINAHGTGTANNDSSEGIAVERLFEGNVPPLSSTKANTGHTLGACGSLEAIYACLAIQHGVIYPNLRFQTQIEEHHFTPVQSLLENQQIHHVMSNSFGFGGNCSSLIFSKP
jgi:3-oxoacyl-[acyl-carrier-protein] synthase-1